MAKQVAGIVSVAAKHSPYHANCLKQSLVIWWLLKRNDIFAEIKIGAKKDASGLQTHAWVEYEGYVLNDRDDIAEYFTPLESPLLPNNIQIV